MNKNYYIQQIRDLSKNYDSETQSKILDDLTDKFFDVKGIKELYDILMEEVYGCLLYTSPSPRDATLSRMPSSA